MSLQTLFGIALLPSTYFHSEEKEPQIIRHNTLTGLAYLPLVGGIASIINSLFLYQNMNKTISAPKELQSARLALVTATLVRAVISTFTGPFILPFIDLSITIMFIESDSH